MVCSKHPERFHESVEKIKEVVRVRGLGPGGSWTGNPVVDPGEAVSRKSCGMLWMWAARTFVSAPLGTHPQTPVPIGDNKPASAQPSAPRRTEHTLPLGRATAWRERGPPCQPRWAFIGRPPHPWAKNTLGSAQPFCRCQVLTGHSSMPHNSCAAPATLITGSRCDSTRGSGRVPQLATRPADVGERSLARSFWGG